VTALNTWQEGEDGRAGTRAFVQCEGCFPPRFAYGDRARLVEYGWRFDDFESGPHRCPLCPPSGVREPPASALMLNPALPNLVIVGAAKCGTTSLHSYLAAHPEIHMSSLKELRFFQDPASLDRLDHYARFFDADLPVRGESTPAYTCEPLVPGVAGRIRAALPDAKLIYLVRDPVERAVAGYAEARANDKEERDPDAALGDVDDPYNAYVAQSRYAMQMEHYLEVFPRERILVIHQEHLLGWRAETLRRVFAFLEVDEGFRSPQFEELANTRAQKRRRNRMGRMLRRSRVTQLAGRLPSRPRRMLARSLHAVTSRSIEVAITPAVRRRLEDALGDEIAKVGRLAGSASVWPD